MDTGPTNHPFLYDINYAPLFFNTPSQEEKSEFDRMFITLVRHYWKQLRSNVHLTHKWIVGNRFPLTCGELAILSIRRKHNMR
jgi:hypothetical protein